MAYQYGKLDYGEEEKVPMLTNLPQTAVEAEGAGQPVYFLSDRPETEEFLAGREKARMPAFKHTLRDVPPPRPSPEKMNLWEAWQNFLQNEGKNIPGIDPDVEGQKAKDAVLRQIDVSTMGRWDAKTRDFFFKKADTESNKARDMAFKRLEAVRGQFEKDFARKRPKPGEPAKKALDPIQLQTAYPQLTAEEASIAADAWNRGMMNAYNEIVRGKKLAPPAGKQPTFKEEKLRELWNRLPEDVQLKALDALPPDKELTEKNILDVYGNIFTDEGTKKALQPIVEEITKRAATKRGPGPNPIKILPEGSKLIGTKNGKKVYETPDGRRFMEQ